MAARSYAALTIGYYYWRRYGGFVGCYASGAWPDMENQLVTAMRREVVSYVALSVVMVAR